MSTLVETLEQRRQSLLGELQRMAEAAVAADNRALSVEEQTKFDQMFAEVESLGERVNKLREDEQRARDIEAS